MLEHYRTRSFMYSSGIAATIPEVWNLLLPSRDKAEISRKRRKSSKQPNIAQKCNIVIRLFDIALFWRAPDKINGKT